MPSHRPTGPYLAAALVLVLVCGGLPAAASMPPGAMRAPLLVSPLAEATVHEGGLELAWRPVHTSDRHFVLIARRPFDASGRTRLPENEAIHVREVTSPVVAFADLGVTPGLDGRLWWAAGDMDPQTGQVVFSETRALTMVPKFANAVAPTPDLRTSPILAATPVPRGPDMIRLRAGYTFAPGGAAPSLPATLSAAPTASGHGTFIVYYGDDDPAAARDRILAAGGRVVAYIPDHAFLVRTPSGGSAARRGFASASGARWVGDYEPAYKLSPRLGLNQQGSQTVDVLVFQDGDLDATAGVVAGLGGRVLRRSDNGINKIMRLELPAPALAALATHTDVAWIEPYVPFEMNNANDQWIVQTGTLNDRRVWDMGLRGEGQVLMTSDSGVYVDHEMFKDPLVPLSAFGDYPTHRKVIAYKKGSVNDSVTFGDHIGHGTHTAGTLLGNNDGYATSANDPYDGMAKDAKLYFMDISGPSLGNLVDPFLDLNDLFLPPYQGNAGGAARISSNSWGAPNGGVYDLNALTSDQFVWSHPDFLIFYANGNSGPTGFVGSPATSKNCVGAGGTVNYVVSGDTTKIKTIYIGTSRGPTDDGRRKPTICAPGQNVRSAYTGSTNTYVYLTGTSMATPSMAGAAALVREYLTEGWYPTGAPVPGNAFDPSAALVKAMCVNSAVDSLTGYHAPDDNIGYGRIRVDDVLYFPGDARRLLLSDFTSGLGNGQAIEYQVNVVTDTIPLEATLCWMDYPGDPASAVQLVNDLNLTVTNGVQVYKGNNYFNGFSIWGGSYDDRNVEEAVRIQNPTPGLWTIRIEGANVPVGPQPFGLCITGGVGTTAGAVALDRPEYGSASTVQVRVVDTNAGPTVDVTLASNTEPAGETVTLTGSDGVFTGSIDLTPFDGTNGDGLLQVSHGDTVTATYDDASPVATLTATAGVSFLAPVITDVNAANQGGVLSVTWNTDRNASSQMYYGLTPALGQETTLDSTAALQHEVSLIGLTPGDTYYFDVESKDLTGNVTRDDNGGQHYRFTVNPPADYLVVMDGGFSRPGSYYDAFDSLGIDVDVWGPALAVHSPLGNTSYGLRAYKAVWWQPGLEEYPPIGDTARDSLTAYLDGGGRLAICGHDMGWALCDSTGGSPYFSTARAAWVAHTLHATFQADPSSWTDMVGITGDPISGDYTGGTNYVGFRPGGWGDEIDAYADTGTVNHVWRTVEATPADCGVRWESTGPLGTPGTAFWGGEVSRSVAMFFEWTSIDDAVVPSTMRNDIMARTLAWLVGRGLPGLAATAPNGGETVTEDTLSINWSETPAAGTSIVSRRLEYSIDGGQSWTLITNAPGASPYLWDLTSVPNTATALVRVSVTDDGTPPFSRSDASDAVFAIQRAGGDTLGPVVTAGSITVSPNPIINQQAATLSASISDANSGGADVDAAEWSLGDTAAAPGTGTAMTGAFPAVTLPVSAALGPVAFPLGVQKLWVRGHDAAGNWGPASALSVVVDGVDLTGVGDAPLAFELRQNAPNPVSGTTTIAWATPSAGPVSLTIHDVQGRLVKALVRGRVGAGRHSMRWDRTDDSGRAVEPGVYYLRLKVGGRTFLKRMVTLR